jgi:hypothetical protein
MENDKQIEFLDWIDRAIERHGDVTILRLLDIARQLNHNKSIVSLSQILENNSGLGYLSLSQVYGLVIMGRVKL